MARDGASDEALIRAIDHAEEFSYSSDDNSQLANDRAKAIDYFLGTNTDPAPEGRSQVGDRSVFETIQWILPSLIDIFANGDDVVALAPIGPDDEQSAKQEGQYLNHVALKKTPWFQVCLEWFIDACLTRNAYVYVYRDYKRNVEIESYERQTRAGIALLTMGPNGQPDPSVEILEQEAYPDPDGGMEPVIGESGQPLVQLVIDPQTGQQMPQPVMQPAMLYNITIRRTEKEGRYCIDVLPPERCKISHRTPDFRLERCPYFEYYEYKTLSDLRAEGFDIPDDIESDSDDDDLTIEAYARDRFAENVGDDKPADPSMRRVKARTIWIQHDYDGDGIAEMQRVIRVGRQVLKREEVGRIHVASIVPLILPHRHIGLSVADITMDLQDIKRAILRGGLDNLYLSNNGRIAVSNKVNIDDVLISRPGQPIRVDSDMADVGQHVVPVVAPFIFPQAMEGLDYVDTIKESRTGVSRNFNGLDEDALAPNQSGVAINQLSTMAAQRVKLIARIFGDGMKDLFSILHEVILKSGHKKEVVQIRGEWVEVDPATWKKRKDFDLSVGYAAGNRDALVQRLSLLGQKQFELLTAGVPIVTPQNLYETNVELTKAADFSQPDRFWTDPRKIPPKPPQPDPIIAQAQIKAQSDQQTTQMQLAQKDAQAQREEALKKYIADMEAQTQLIVKSAEAAHQKALEHIRGEHAAGLAAIGAALDPKTTEAKTGADQSKQHGDLIAHITESQKAHHEQMKQMMGEMTKALKAISGPKKAVRGKDGRIEQVVPA